MTNIGIFSCNKPNYTKQSKSNKNNCGKSHVKVARKSSNQREIHVICV